MYFFYKNVQLRKACIFNICKIYKLNIEYILLRNAFQEMLFHALKVLKIFIFLTNIFSLYLAIYRYQFIYLSSHISKIYKGVLAWELNVAWKRPRL